MHDEQNRNEAFLVTKNLKKYRLSKSKPTTIGREKYNDVVLNDLAVSRQHAVITWDEGTFSVKDMNSQNGTFLNDKKTENSFLSHQDVIRIGDNELIVQFSSREEIDILMVQNQVRIATHKTIKTVPPMKFSDTGFTGKLESLSIDEIVQVVNQSQKSGVLIINRDSGKRGVDEQIFFEKGEIVHAICHEQTGFDAVVPILQNSLGTFEFRNNVVAQEKTITKSTVWVLLEAHRLKDETDRDSVQTDKA